MAGIRDEEEALKRESERLDRTVERRHGFTTKSEQLDKPQGGPNTDLHFDIRGLPAEPKEPVQILVNGEAVFSSETLSGDVNVKFDAPINKGWGNSVTVTLKIPVMGFENGKKFSLGDGFFIKFEANEKGLTILQKNKPFQKNKHGQEVKV